MPAGGRRLSVAATKVAFLNRAAGGCDDAGAWRDRLQEAGFRVRAEASAEETRRAAAGDGTVHAVANGLLSAPGDPPPLGVLPLGTANDYARSLGIPRDDSGAALELLAAGSARAVDVIEIRHRPTGTAGEPGAGGAEAGARASTFCLNVAVGGFGGEVARHLGPEEKHTWGSLAYLRSAVGELDRVRHFRTRLRIDGTVREDVLLNVVAANGRFAGGGVPVAPGARVDDGRFRVVLIPALELREIGRLAGRLLDGRHRKARSMVVPDVEAVTVESEPPMYVRADGEDVGRTPLSLRIRPGALDVVRPPGRDAGDGRRPG